MEVAQVNGVTFVRDSEQPEKILRFSRNEWEDFLAGVIKGEFDVE